MCDCGCNTCETKKPVMLNENIAPKEILSEGLKYHMDNNMPLTEHVYRAGSQSYFNLWAEARALYSRGILEVTGDDLEVLTETDLGHFGMFEGKKVPLDFPIELTEDEAAFEYNKARAGRIMKDLFGFDFEFDYTYKLEGNKIIIHPEGYNPDGTLFDMKDVHKEKIIRTFRDKMPKAQATPNMGGGITVHLRGFSLDENKNRIIVKINGKRLVIDKEDLQRLKSGKDVVGYSTKYAGQQEWIFAKDKWEIEGPLNEAKNYKKGDKLKIKLSNGKEFDVIFDGYLKQDGMAFGKFKDEYGEFETKPFSLDTIINEAKKKAKKNTKKLNKPMRSSSGGKAYKVYVKDPKTGNIKTVRFGSGGLRAKINDKKARNAFAKRHKCSQKKDKTKASYWSCRLPRYSKLLGLKSNFSGFW
jgi:hypothetical protein